MGVLPTKRTKNSCSITDEETVRREGSRSRSLPKRLGWLGYWLLTYSSRAHWDFSCRLSMCAASDRPQASAQTKQHTHAQRNKKSRLVFSTDVPNLRWRHTHTHTNANTTPASRLHYCKWTRWAHHPSYNSYETDTPPVWHRRYDTHAVNQTKQPTAHYVCHFSLKFPCLVCKMCKKFCWIRNYDLITRQML